jgi:hypothetical protein
MSLASPTGQTGNQSASNSNFPPWDGCQIDHFVSVLRASGHVLRRSVEPCRARLPQTKVEMQIPLCHLIIGSLQADESEELEQFALFNNS